MRATLKVTSQSEALVTVDLGNGKRLTLPMQLTPEAHAGLWNAGRLTQVLPPAKGLQLLKTRSARA